MPQPRTEREQRIDFVIGFAGWFIVNSLVWILVRADKALWSSYGSLLIPLVLLPLNLIVLLVLAFHRRWMAFGILMAFAVNLIIGLVVGMFLNALCGIPFFIG